MARKKPTNKAEFLLFNVVYEDGSLSSNRKVPAAELEDGNSDGAVRAYLEAQDRDIAEKSGRPRDRIKSLSRIGGR